MPRQGMWGLLIIVSLAFVIAACDSANLQRDFEEEAEGPPSGITRTDEGGRLVLGSDGEPIEVDASDWQTAPIYIGEVRFDPAYPNPTHGTQVTLPFVVPFSDGLRGGLVLRAFNNTGRFVFLDEVLEASQTGAWTFVFSPSLLSASGDITSIRGLHRLFVFDNRNNLVSYGDLEIE